MIGFTMRFGRFLAATALAAFLSTPTAATAQDEAMFQGLGPDPSGEYWMFHIGSGARMRDFLPAFGYFHWDAPTPTMESISEANPGRLCFACYDRGTDEGPRVSRRREFYDACTAHRSIWFIAGETIRVPLVPDPGVVREPEVRVVPDPADRARINELETQVESLESEISILATSDERAHADLISASETETALDRRIEELEAEASGASTMAFVVITILLPLVALLAFFLFRHRRDFTNIMRRVRRERTAWSRYAETLRKNHAKQLEKLTRGAGDSSKALTRTRARQGQLRARILLYIVHLRKGQDLLLAAAKQIQEFRHRHQEDDERRKRIPDLLTQVDEAHRQRLLASKARARIETIQDWHNKGPEQERQSHALRMHDGTIAGYEQQVAEHEAKAMALDGARTLLAEDLAALTGVRMDSVQVDGRLERAIADADRVQQEYQARLETLADLIRIHEELIEGLSARERVIAARERQADAVAREQEAMASLDAFSTGLVKVEKVRLSEVEGRLAEVEGRMTGYERRAVAAEKDLLETNEFLEKLQPEYKLAKELLEAFKKGPSFLEARVIQMAEYIRELENRLGINRESMLAGLPPVSYGDGKRKPS